MGEFTQLLSAYRDGSKAAEGKLFSAVYSDMRRIAASQLGPQNHHRTLSTTSLVNEAYLKFCSSGQLEVNDREHFMRLAAKVMRQIVIDYAREKNAQKRGGGLRDLSLENYHIAVDDQAVFLLELERALGELENINRRLVQVIEYRYFAGLTEEETAGLLNVTTRTVQRDWLRAKTWLAELISKPSP